MSPTHFIIYLHAHVFLWSIGCTIVVVPFQLVVALAAAVAVVAAVEELLSYLQSEEAEVEAAAEEVEEVEEVEVAVAVAEAEAEEGVMEEVMATVTRHIARLKTVQVTSAITRRCETSILVLSDFGYQLV